MLRIKKIIISQNRRDKPNKNLILQNNNRRFVSCGARMFEMCIESA